MEIRHILVATDLSEEALRPFAPVADLARAVGARITLLHVVQDLRAIPHGAPTAPKLEDPALHGKIEEARAQLEQQGSEFGDLPVDRVVISGFDVALTIAEYAADNDVDLVAISTHGRTGFRRLVLGSVAEALLRRTSVPVLVFPRT